MDAGSTGSSKGNATRSVEQGAASIVWGATKPSGERGPTGSFFRDGRLLEW